MPNIGPMELVVVLVIALLVLGPKRLPAAGSASARASASSSDSTQRPLRARRRTSSRTEQSPQPARQFVTDPVDVRARQAIAGSHTSHQPRASAAVGGRRAARTRLGDRPLVVTAIAVARLAR